MHRPRCRACGLEAGRSAFTAGVRRVIVVSEPDHLWRVERLARGSGFVHDVDVQYAAAPTACWQRWGLRFRGALREPLAIVNNAFHGDF